MSSIVNQTPANILSQPSARGIIFTHPVFFLTGRLAFSLLLLFTSLYCLLSFVPFTYHWVIKGELIPWLPFVVKYHPLFYLVTLCLVSLTLKQAVRRPQTQRLAIGFLVSQFALSGWLFFSPLLPALGNNDESFRWSLIALFPLLWLATIDFMERLPERKWETESRQPSLTLCDSALAAMFLAIMYAGMCVLRFRGQGTLHMSRGEAFVVAGWGIFSYLLIFTTIFIIIKLVRAVATRFANPARARFLLNLLVGSLAGTFVIFKFLLTAIAFDTSELAKLYAIAVSVTIAALIGGIRLGLAVNEKKAVPHHSPRTTDDKQAVAHDDSTQPVEAHSQARANRLSKVFNSLPVIMRRHLFTVRALAWALALPVLAYIASASFARMDWDFLLQKVGALLVWTIAFFALRFVPRKVEKQKQHPIYLLLIVGVICLMLFRFAPGAQAKLPRLVGDENLNVKAVLENYAAHDVSFRVSQEIFSAAASFSLRNWWKKNFDPALHNLNPTLDPNSLPEPNENDGFYDYLKANTNLLPAVKVEPVEIKLVENFKPSEGDKPNIFIIVVDSLRQDYLTPYNPKINFTPQIDSFARESIVMKNAFTPYGGTVLAEPAIWTGTLQLHKQFIEPFYPLNTLQKLIEAENYDSYVTLDPVLKIIVKPSAQIKTSDQYSADTEWQRLNLRNSLNEFRAQMDARSDKTRPVFGYTQPQNIHIRNVEFNRTRKVQYGDFPGFDSYYAHGVRDLDQAFGEFIEYLKSSGQYDNSIVVLTSDHGDSLGELGRWGHSTWIFPEILRIPLIVHLPPKLREGLYWDDQTAAFSSDITPSLYYLLGHRPIISNEFFGKPLFTRTQREQADYRQRDYMVASSYGPTYGILSNNARNFFISDATNQKDYYFDLQKDPQGLRNLVTAEVRAQNEKLLRQRIEAINSFFKVNP